MGDQEDHRLPSCLRIKPSMCRFPERPQHLPHIAGIYLFLHLYQQGGSLSARLKVNLCVMSSIDTTRLFDPTEFRPHFGQFLQGFQELFKQLSLHYVRVKHHDSTYFAVQQIYEL
ncbi:MAG: hypothetical protein OXF74_02780 [Rhodobacteraceae bacterium]|nr:hypothetical protein [Paracoccaceae bacterium]